MDPFSLKNKTILITGASSGIGRSCAIACSNSDANVVLISRNESKLKETMELLKEGNHMVMVFDVNNFTAIDDLVASIFVKYGKIDGFVHSAGIEKTLPVSLTKPLDYQELFNTNVIASFEFIKALSKKKYCSENGASYIVISSVMSIVGSSGRIAYSASKGAIVSGTRSLAIELAPKKIRVNNISPGVVETDMIKKLFDTVSEESKQQIIREHPLGIGSPSDVAHACVYLLSDASIWITGSNLIIDGGYSCK